MVTYQTTELTARLTKFTDKCIEEDDIFVKSLKTFSQHVQNSDSPTLTCTEVNDMEKLPMSLHRCRVHSKVQK